MTVIESVGPPNTMSLSPRVLTRRRGSKFVSLAAVNHARCLVLAASAMTTPFAEERYTRPAPAANAVGSVSMPRSGRARRQIAAGAASTRLGVLVRDPSSTRTTAVESPPGLLG
jgi:hypothetical protein